MMRDRARRRGRFALWVVLIGALSATGAARQTPQQPPPQPPPAGAPEAAPPQPQQPIFRTGVNFVRVDVIVTDGKGNPVTDLQAADFDVFEDSKPQKVESFKLVKIDAASEAGAAPPRPIRTSFDEESEAARDDVRLIALLMDDYHVRRGASLVVKEPLARFVENQLSPADLVGIMYPLTPVGDMQLTRDRKAILGAIQSFDGRKFDYTPRNAFEERYSMYPASVVERVRNQVTLSALKALVIHLGGLREGRKAVILVSEGFTNLLPPQLRDPVASLPGFGNPDRRNPNAGDNDPREETAAFFANVDLQTEMREVWDAANRANTAIYTLDPRGLAGFEFDINEGVGLRTDAKYLASTQDTLRTIADQTDGRAIVNRNDLEGGLKQVVRDSSVYYLLGYNSSQAPQDGKFHDIKVRVKRPGGLQVRARKGYWALTVEETARATAPPKAGPPPAVSKALASIVEPVRGRVARTWIGTSRGENGKTRVMFVWEPVPAPPGERRREPARVALTATATSGAPYFRGRVPDAPLASAAPPATTGTSGPATPTRVVFDANPGTMELRLSIESATGEVLDTDTRDVTVPDFTATDLRLSTPVVLRARTLRELQTLAADPDAVPAVSREFRRTDRLLIRFDAYGPGGAPLHPTARLLNRGGQAMSDLPVTRPGSDKPFQLDVPLASVPPGEYLIEIKVKNESGETQELVAFRLVS